MTYADAALGRIGCQTHYGAYGVSATVRLTAAMHTMLCLVVMAWWDLRC